MTCCPVGKHAQAADIDRAIRAQQAASLANASTSAPSYSQIARTYGVRKATLFAHRDECLADRSGVPGRSDGVPVRTAGGTYDENTSGSARVDRYAGAVPASDAEGVDGQAGRATGPPKGVGQRGPGVSDASDEGRSGASSSDRAGSASMEAGQARPTERPRPDARARARAATRWDGVGLTSIDAAAQRVTHVIADSELTDPKGPRAHATYVHEIVELIDRDEWNHDLTATRLAREWNKPKLFILGCYRDACTLMRIARGSPEEDRESSLRRWIKLFRAAMDKGDAMSMKVAADALKGYDAAAGIVDKRANVNINIAQSDEAKLFVSIFLDEAKGDPALLERIRRRLAEARDKLGDPTAILTTGAEVDAAE